MHDTALRPFMQCKKYLHGLSLDILTKETAPTFGSLTYCDNFFYCQLTRKYSSCSSIWMDESTLSKPNHRNIVQCMTLAVYYHIKYRDANRSLDIFDERLHPLTVSKLPEDYFQHDPEHECIYRFVAIIFNALCIPTECTIMTLVYLERLMSYAKIDLCPTNWKRIVLGAILLAFKVWHDKAVWNIYFCRILQNLALQDINQLERHYLCLLEFNVNVSASTYAKYYFDLRSLADHSNMYFVSAPLTKERARKIEAMSRHCEDGGLHRGEIRKSSSDDSFTGIRLSKAILS
ncbi:cyclin-Y-like protein 1 [Cavia porcellus]|uniref:cyclin-Y-like protein 1 n=1 Tax=Cavia porcellus TaxID=10141 RepID=UPI002FDF872C